MDIKKNELRASSQRSGNTNSPTINNYKDFDNFYKNEHFDYRNISDEDFVIAYSITLMVNYIFRISKKCDISPYILIY